MNNHATSSAPGTPTKHGQRAAEPSKWAVRNPVFWSLLYFAWLVQFFWFVLQIVISCWAPDEWNTSPQFLLNDSVAYYYVNAFTLPNFVVRTLILPAVTISMVHAEREHNLAAAFVSFTTISVNTMAWIVLNATLVWGALSSNSTWVYGALCTSTSETLIHHSWCHLLQVEGVIACVHFAVFCCLWFYSFYQMARNERMNPLQTWLPLDKLNTALVVIGLIGYFIWAVPSAYLGTRGDRDYNSSLVGSTTLDPYMHTGLFFGLVLAAYVCFGAGRRLVGTALAIIWSTAMVLFPIFLMEARRMYQYRIELAFAVANPPQNLLNPGGPADIEYAACGPNSNHCTAARASTAGLGILSATFIVLSFTVWAAYFRAPDDATPVETGQVPAAVYTGPGYVNTVPNTYKGNDLEAQAFINNANAGNVSMAAPAMGHPSLAGQPVGHTASGQPYPIMQQGPNGQSYPAVA